MCLTIPGTVQQELPNLGDEINIINQETAVEMYKDLLENVSEMRKRNAVKMKARWDTVNTQQVRIGDFVLVDPRVKKKWRKKDILGERVFSMPGKVIEVNANGNIRVTYKNGSVTPVSSPVPNNKFKVVDEDLYNSVDMASILDDSDDSDEVPSYATFILINLLFTHSPEYASNWTR